MTSSEKKRTSHGKIWDCLRSGVIETGQKLQKCKVSTASHLEVLYKQTNLVEADNDTAKMG